MATAGATVVRRNGSEPVAAVSTAATDPSSAAVTGFSVSSDPTTTEAPSTTIAPPTTVASAGAARPAAKTPTTSAPTGPARRDFGPRPPGSVDLPYVAGQTEWTATSNGVAMDLRMQTTNPSAGAPVRFVLDGTPPAGMPCCFFNLQPGDATPFSGQTSKGTTEGCVAPTTGHQRMEATETFNHGGRFEFAFQVSSICINPNDAGYMFGFVDIGPGPSTAQGPDVPTLNAGDGRVPSQMSDPTLVVAWAEARDEDGFIAGFSVDWGDGTPVETFAGDPLGCRQGASGWPQSSQTLIQGSSRLPPPSHRYAAAKPAMVTVAVWSTGCDGSDVQRVTSSFPWIPPMTGPPVGPLGPGGLPLPPPPPPPVPPQG